ncbi:MAG TPA: ribosomal protein S18-alanine N-acetyltransferase [Sphingomicrobium sp.]
MATLREPEFAVQLRPGRVADLDEVMRIMAAAFPPCFGEAWTRSQCAGILPMQGVTLTLAEQAGRPIGFSLVRAVADEAELLLLAVDPAEQRRGIGQALLHDFIATALAGGGHRLHLEVRDGNPAVELYRTSGFAIAGRRRNYYHGQDGEAYDAITLMLVD